MTNTLVMAKELYPGKRNELEVLCDRLQVDNSGRTLHGAVLMDLRVFNLPVLSANEQELAAHETVLKQIDKDSKGKTVWRVLLPAAAG